MVIPTSVYTCAGPAQVYANIHSIFWHANMCICLCMALKRLAYAAVRVSALCGGRQGGAEDLLRQLSGGWLG